MRSLVICLFAAVLSVPAIPGAQAALNDFAGNWQNSDRNTRGITRLQITRSGKNLQVHAWGSCSPKDCDWGVVTATPYAAKIEDKLARAARTATAIFKQGHADTILII